MTSAAEPIAPATPRKSPAKIVFTYAHCLQCALLIYFCILYFLALSQQSHFHVHNALFFMIIGALPLGILYVTSIAIAVWIAYARQQFRLLATLHAPYAVAALWCFSIETILG